MAERLYSVQQTADLLGTSVTEVRQWVDLGRLPAEQMAGAVWVSEHGLVRFLTDRGIDLGQILGAALRPSAPAASRPADAATPTRQTPPTREPDPADAGRPAEPAPARGDAASRLAEAILHDALRRGADAIFLEPVPGSLTLKLRAGGRVREKPRFASRLPTGLGPLLLARFRLMAHMADIAGRDAAFSVHVAGQPRPFRIEDRPGPHGPGLAIYPVEPGC